MRVKAQIRLGFNAVYRKPARRKLLKLMYNFPEAFNDHYEIIACFSCRDSLVILVRDVSLQTHAETSEVFLSFGKTHKWDKSGFAFDRTMSMGLFESYDTWFVGMGRYNTLTV